MSSLISPNWTDSIAVIAPTKLSASTGYARGTIDLRSKRGAKLFCKLGRLTTTVLATAINVYVRPLINGGVAAATIPYTHPTAPQFQSQIAVTVCPTVNTNALAGAKSLTLSAGTSIVAGDIICISDSGGTTFNRLEFKTVSKVVTNVLTLAEPLEFDHSSANADIVSRLADVFPYIPLAGGSVYEVIFDYQVSATGGDVVVLAHAQSYDTDTVT